MEFTNMTLDCYGVTPTADSEAFRIEATVTAAGELPTTALFVTTIRDTMVPDSDAFARIANPQDLQNLTRDRAAAVAAETKEYLTSFASFQYDDLDQAVAAKETLKSRVNELVNRWISFQTSFILDTGVSSSFPSADPTVEEALVTTYTDARDERIAAASAFLDADVSVTIATAALAQARVYLPTIQRASTDLTRINNELYDYGSAVLNEGTTAASKRTNLGTFLSDEAAFFASSVQTQMNLIAGQESALATLTDEKRSSNYISSRTSGGGRSSGSDSRC